MNYRPIPTEPARPGFLLIASAAIFLIALGIAFFALFT